MTAGILTKYNASAGSGKTFRLTGAYLDHLFRLPNNHRNILAVTFTNKAAAEMKERILGSLYLLGSGASSDYLSRIHDQTGLSDDLIKKRALSNLEAILHDYSRFSVGTIDSFFQKILRAFARESGLQAGFNLVLDHSVVLSEAIDELLKESDENPVLLKWLTEYAYSEVQSGKHWNLKRKIEELGSEIFRENYRLLYQSGMIVRDKEKLGEALSELSAVETLFREKIKQLAERGIAILLKNGVTGDILYKKSNSILKFFSDSVEKVPDKLSASIQEAYSEGRYTTGKALPAPVKGAIEDGIEQVVSEMVIAYESGITGYRSARLVLDNLYTLGLLNDIALKVREILSESNKFLLSDAGDVLRQIIGKDQAPFIYEKVGNRYTNFMIDEFQDTSWIQWDNFLPLITNSLSGGEDNLVVGDVKQAIYRWRNSDWRIFNEIQNLFPAEQFRNVPLTDNWRSKTNIIRFNNTLFSRIPQAVEQSIDLAPGTISGLYEGVSQTDPGKSEGGFVRIKRVDATPERHQNDLVLDDLPLLIEEIQDMGYLPGEIGILVRTNVEGRKVIDSILNYSSTIDAQKKRKYSYQVISQDSLLLAFNPSIKFILSTLRFLSDNNDSLAFASMAHHYSQLLIDEKDDQRPMLIQGDSETEPARILPDGYEEFFRQIRFLPVFEIVDRIVKFFGLSGFTSGIPFITTFQDLVLELSGTEANDIPLFLEWWDNEGHGKSVSSPEQPGAMQLMTIHKSKGLEFRVVILPFLSWTFNHGKAPVLWVKSDVAPFDRLGAVPVTYRQEISGTLFANYYEEERIQAAIDKLNLLYVALTRARECIFGYVPVGKNIRHCGREVMDALEGGVMNEPEGADTGQWDSEAKVFTLGKIPRLSARDDRVSSMEIPYNVELSSERLKLKFSSTDYLPGNNHGRADRINWGLIMHELFESASTGDDLMPGIAEMRRSGRISGEQFEYLSGKISGYLENEIIASWFRPGVEVRRESAIITEGGVVRRPDRVIIEPGRVTIIDFKFGEEKKSYRSQLAEYRTILEKMGYKNVTAFIWYFESGTVEEV